VASGTEILLIHFSTSISSALDSMDLRPGQQRGDADLAPGPAEHKRLAHRFLAHPTYSKGSHDSDDYFSKELVLMRENGGCPLKPTGADLVLCGTATATSAPI